MVGAQASSGPSQSVEAPSTVHQIVISRRTQTPFAGSARSPVTSPRSALRNSPTGLARAAARGAVRAAAARAEARAAAAQGVLSGSAS